MVEESPDELTVEIEELSQKDEALLKCTLCGEICKRAVNLSCCGSRSQACRSCAVKKVTNDRSCWSCPKSDLRLDEDLINFEELRDASSFYKDNK